MKPNRTRWSIGAALAAAAALLVATPTTAAQAEDPLTMVAIGDSQAAGPLITSQNSWDCLRSDANWPHVAAQQLGASLTDVTCSGATTSDLTGKRFGYMAPQLDAVHADTDIVTVTIGANDLNLGTLVPSCMNPLPSPFGVSCKTWNADTYDAQLVGVGTRVAAAVQAIHQKAPAARVFLVGYYQYWGKSGCYPIDPIWSVDAAWLQSIFDRLNAKLATVAAANQATYVDLSTPSKDHGVCASQSQKWVEGLFPTSDAAPYHPNRAGMAAGGAIVAAAID
ncbi:SGNH/GDSL hydrolase family protein [Nocardioides humilatus]|uniref:SGNH/GDSL hydrolase family protein n=1 Tax=Nocardioides humilatus TaxID=2607660 RepID=A0A5B1LLN2_9ACTN|nr:SGNH/GDSL hydrolase family protein [Nocardioides humilatus]KAA1421665.1 SGNH/GDSL hydrolase family protein [Nocardioides humilatus]